MIKPRRIWRVSLPYCHYCLRQVREQTFKQLPESAPAHQFRKVVPGLVSHRIGEVMREKFKDLAVQYEKSVFSAQYKWTSEEVCQLRESFWNGSNDQALGLGETKVPGLLQVLQARRLAEAERAEEEAQKALEAKRQEVYEAYEARNCTGSQESNFLQASWSLLQTMLSEQFKAMKQEAEPQLQNALQKIFDSTKKHEEKEFSEALSECLPWIVRVLTTFLISQLLSTHLPRFFSFTVELIIHRSLCRHQLWCSLICSFLFNSREALLQSTVCWSVIEMIELVIQKLCHDIVYKHTATRAVDITWIYWIQDTNTRCYSFYKVYSRRSAAGRARTKVTRCHKRKWVCLICHVPVFAKSF